MSLIKIYNSYLSRPNKVIDSDNLEYLHVVFPLTCLVVSFQKALQAQGRFGDYLEVLDVHALLYSEYWLYDHLVISPLVFLLDN